MHVLLFVASVLAAVVGFAIFAGSVSAIQEQVGAQILLIAAVLFAAAVTVDAIQRLRQSVIGLRRELEARFPSDETS